jgi:Glutathione S-transferase, C-terminal domain
VPVLRNGSAIRKYEAAYDALFATLDELEARLGRQRYLVGRQITEADWRLFPTLVRFDVAPPWSVEEFVNSENQLSGSSFNEWARRSTKRWNGAPACNSGGSDNRRCVACCNASRRKIGNEQTTRYRGRRLGVFSV